jgi:hypothetical protein
MCQAVRIREEGGQARPYQNELFLFEIQCILSLENVFHFSEYSRIVRRQDQFAPLNVYRSVKWE